MFWLYTFVLIILLMFLGLFALIGDTAVRPLRWGALATTLTIIYSWLILSWQNTVELILIPAWNVIMAKEPVTVFGLGAVILVVGVIFYILMMLRTALISWVREGIPYLAK